MDQTQIENEAEALKALYGEEHISFRARQSSTVPASISISLQSLLLQSPHPAGTDITFSALLPDDYPACARPRAPTLRANALSAAECTELVQQMLQTEASIEGEVCLFEYCQALLMLLNDFQCEEDDGKPGGSSTPLEEEAQHIETTYETMHSEPLTDRKSVFQAHAVRIEKIEDVDEVLKQLKRVSRKVAIATHNSLAYRVVGVNGIVQDVDDDGEKGAGKCILYVLQQLEAVNVVCVVSRWFGGIKLGPVRFKHISKVARDLVEQHVDKFKESRG